MPIRNRKTIYLQNKCSSFLVEKETYAHNCHTATVEYSPTDQMLVTMSLLSAVLEEYFFDENPNFPMILCADCSELSMLNEHIQHALYKGSSHVLVHGILVKTGSTL